VNEPKQPRTEAGRQFVAEWGPATVREAVTQGILAIEAEAQPPQEAADGPTCRGCSGTCCTGVGSDPCVCSEAATPDDAALRSRVEELESALEAVQDWCRIHEHFDQVESIERALTGGQHEQSSAVTGEAE
jgi:hypothetical protein